jgi:hypothetical protein
MLVNSGQHQSAQDMLTVTNKHSLLKQTEIRQIENPPNTKLMQIELRSQQRSNEQSDVEPLSYLRFNCCIDQTTATKMPQTSSPKLPLAI